MANIWRDAVLTQKGTALLAKLTGGHSLKITKAEAGSGSVPAVGLVQQTAVSIPQQTLAFSTISFPETGKVKIPAILKNDDVTEAYTARQVGLYAEDPDEGEILFIILQADQYSEVPGVAVPAAEEQPGFTAEWDLVFQYGQAQDVTVTVDPANTVSQETMEQYVTSQIGGIKTEVLAEVSDSVQTAIGQHGEDIDAHGDLFDRKADKTLGNVETSDFDAKAVAAGLEGGAVSAVSTDGSMYTATVAGFAALKNGMRITIIPSMGSTTTLPKLNINGLGAKNIKQRLSINTTTPAQAKDAAWMTANKPLPLLYDGLQWVTITPRPSANDMYGEIAIVNGGTGADNAADARDNLGITALLANKLEAELLTTAEYRSMSDEDKRENVLYLLSDDQTDQKVADHLLDTENPHGVTAVQIGAAAAEHTHPALAPSGGVILWSGAADAIPDSWTLCDGTSGAPDLRDHCPMDGLCYIMKL